MLLDKFKFGKAEPQTEFGKDLQRSILDFSESLLDLLNGGLRLDENFDLQLVSVTTSATPDTEGAVAHTLKRVPVGYIVYSKDKGAHIYDGTTPATTTNIYVRSDAATVTAKLIVF